MKKLLTFGLMTLLLSGCSLLNKKETSNPASSKTTTATSTTTNSDAVEETKSFRYEVKNGEHTQISVHTITYRGNQITQIRQQVTSLLFNEETLAHLRQQNLDAVKPELLAFIEEQDLTKTLRQTAGVTNLSFDINSNYDVVTDITIDPASADFTTLANNSGFGLDLLDLKNTTAKQYMARMKIRLAQEVAPQ